MNITKKFPALNTIVLLAAGLALLALIGRAQPSLGAEAFAPTVSTFDAGAALGNIWTFFFLVLAAGVGLFLNFRPRAED